jgi:hypothetical protein
MASNLYPELRGQPEFHAMERMDGHDYVQARV